MRISALVLFVLVLALPAAARADADLALSFSLAHYVDYAPGIDEQSTSRPFAFQFAYRIRPKVALGIAAEAFQSQVDSSVKGGKRLDEVTAIPISIAGYYYPLDGTFNPYLVGLIGPVIATEHFTEDVNGETVDSSASAIGPMIGFGTGIAFRWPVTPLAEVRCQLGFPDGERVSQLTTCGLSVGVGMSF